MAEQRFSAQAGPVNDLYEFDDPVQRTPIPPKQPETDPAVPGNDTTYGYDGQQQCQQQTGSFPIRSPSGYAPQTIDQQQRQQHSPGEIAPNPELPIGTSHSPQPPQETLPSGRHLSLTASSIVSPIDSYPGSYQTRPDSGSAQPTNAAAAPHYNVPMTGYYVPGVHYNENHSYGVGAAPYPQAQSPPPLKPEHSYYEGAPPLAPDGDKKKKKICGMGMTIFLVLCVILFLVIAGAILGGVFGSGVLPKNNNDPVTTSGPTPTTITSTTTSDTITTSTSTTNYAYPIPTGTWTITGGLTVTTGTCINNPNITNYKEVWYCPENQNETIVIHDYSTNNKLSYFLDMDTPTRVRGVSGTPPTGENSDNNKSPFWKFNVRYKQQAPFTTGDSCEVDVDLVFLLGRTQAIAGFVE
ncbi:hypothetical protein BGX38DRAFT_1264258 [Terfezia claveryi]|nr:hypothetical protein BGX38DRAFT_1264258 [Terfezia claveryi]